MLHCVMHWRTYTTVHVLIMAEADSDNSWETCSVDSDGYSDESGLPSSSDDSRDSGDESGGEVFVSGAEPYRFEPLAAKHDETRGAEADTVESTHVAVDENRLQTTNW